MNSEQKRYLQDRLESAVRNIRYPDDEPKEPARVTAARKTIEVFQEAHNKAENKRNREIDAARIRVRQLILFGKQEDALEAVVAFEKRSFK